MEDALGVPVENSLTGTANQRCSIPVSADWLSSRCFGACSDVTSYPHGSPSHLLASPIKQSFLVWVPTLPGLQVFWASRFFCSLPHLWLDPESGVAEQLLPHYTPCLLLVPAAKSHSLPAARWRVPSSWDALLTKDSISLLTA